MNILRGGIAILTLTLILGCGSKPPDSGTSAKDAKGNTSGDKVKPEGKPVTVDMKVGFFFAHRDGLILAEENGGEKDYKGVSVFIPNDKIAGFGAKTANEVGDKYDGKKITVNGKVAKKTLDVERSVIEVTEPGQIKE